MQQPDQVAAHINLTKWTTDLMWQPDIDTLWKDIWRPFRNPVESCFLWQIIYRISATNHWQYPGMASTNPLTLCVTCGTHKDLMHTQWNCPNAREVWRWVERVLQAATLGHRRAVHIDIGNALLGDELFCDDTTPLFLWHIFWGVANWQIWKARCLHNIQHIPSTLRQLQEQIWYRAKLYLRVEWHR